MKFVDAFALILLFAFAQAGVLGPSAKEYLEVDSVGNMESRIRDTREPHYGLYRLRRDHDKDWDDDDDGWRRGGWDDDDDSWGHRDWDDDDGWSRRGWSFGGWH